jgi:5'-methylthioadenosine phosphorylase
MGDENRIGITGGTGVYEIVDLEVLDQVEVDTPFGQPSDQYIIGRLQGVDVVFLARHGRGHKLPACGVNYRANIYGFKSLGCDTLLSVSAVGSMKEQYRPTDIVIPDQFFDNTKRRESTFFTGTPAVHVDLADPTCPVLGELLHDSAVAEGANVHKGGTYICIDGPPFSTRAESKTYRGWGVDVIGMTGATEVKLCREAEMCYGTMALVTDYDVWKEDAEDVTIEAIVSILHENAETAKSILKDVILKIPEERPCGCREALKYAIVTHPDAVSDELRRTLHVLTGKYLPYEEEL